jgi:hypothetical protein
MKRLFLTAFAAISISTMAVAQDNNHQPGQRPNDTEMAKKRTQDMVQTYGLDAKQEKKLLKLNTKYAGKMCPGPRMHGPGPQMMHGNGQQPSGNDNERPPFPAPEMGNSNGQQMPAPPSDADREKFEKRMQEGQSDMEAYHKQLKKIMTTDQYDRYQSDMKQKMQCCPRGQKPNSEQK